MRLLYSIALLGGDARQRYLAALFRRAGYPVLCYGVPGLADSSDSLAATLCGAQIICLGMPAVRAGCLTGLPSCTPQQLAALLPPEGILFGGGLSDFTPALLPPAVRVFDYLQDPALLCANAELTAEGALSLALQALPIALKDASVLVTGFGRIGKSLAMKLHLLGARVTLTSRRRESRSAIEALGCLADETVRYHLGLLQYACVFNTVPAPVFSADQLQALSPSCVYLELASAPGGIAPDAPKPPLYLPAPGLPAKTAPESAARVIYRAICASPYFPQEVL